MIPVQRLLQQAQLDTVSTLAMAMPSLRINVDHLAYPNTTGPFDTQWADQIRAVARWHNVRF